MICSDIRNCYMLFQEPLGEWNLRQFWNITSGIYAKYHVRIMLLFVYTTTQKRFLIFTCRYFILLSGNTTVVSQSNCRNFSCSSITRRIVWEGLTSNGYYLENDLIFLPYDSSPLQHFAALAVILSYPQTSYLYHLAEI